MKKPVSSVTGDKDDSAAHPPAAPGESTHGRRRGRRLAVPDGRSSRWAAHRAARREELIDAAITAITSQGAAVGMDQIAAAAKTSKPVIYRYFTDKDDLYRAVSRRVATTVLDTLIEAMSGDPEPREVIHAGVDAYLALLDKSPELYRFVAQHPLVAVGSDGAATDFSSVVADLIGQRLAAHLDTIGLDPALAHPWGDGIGGFINAASLWWLDHRDAMSRPQLTDYLAGLLWGGAAGVYQYAGKKVDARPVGDVFSQDVLLHEPRPRG